MLLNGIQSDKREYKKSGNDKWVPNSSWDSSVAETGQIRICVDASDIYVN